MKKEFQVPSYRGGSIVNLMSSISKSYGTKHPYEELNILSSKELKKADNVVLFVVDGLGYEFLKNKCKDSFIEKNIIGPMTSTFLPTTACANATYDFGLPPQQTALTGWDMNIKEVGSVVNILPFTSIAGASLNDSGIDINEIINVDPILNKFKAECSLVICKDLANSAFTSKACGKSKQIGYSSMRSMFSKIKKTIKKKSKLKKYIHVYEPYFDSLSHRFGINSDQSMAYFKELNKKFEKFIKKIKGTNTKVLLVADHGLIDTKKKDVVWLEDHPLMEECLSMCLSGEPRCRYCYVRPGKALQFEAYVKNKMSKYCWIYKGKDLIDNDFYGFGDINPKLHERVGDYVLIMKENYILKDRLSGQEKKSSIGKHGGVSKDELLVPLAVFDC